MSRKPSIALPATGESPERGDCFRSGCVARSVLAHVTGRWGSLVVGALERANTLRFSELRTRIEGISEKMLAQTLRDLTRDGIISRFSHNTVPPHVDYELTGLGRGVAKHVASLLEWIDANAPALAYPAPNEKSPSRDEMG